MTYGAFLVKCRQLASQRNNRALTRAEFARLLDVDERYYSNVENGEGSPGRLMLEQAAIEAGFAFEDCIVIPNSPPDSSLKAFKDALNDWRESIARKYATDLSTMKKPKRKKTGGRPGKSSGSSAS